MKIFSNFKDYYDYASGWHDERVTYVRDRGYSNWQPKFNDLYYYFRSNYVDNYRFYFFIICNKIYMVYSNITHIVTNTKSLMEKDIFFREHNYSKINNIHGVKNIAKFIDNKVLRFSTFFVNENRLNEAFNEFKNIIIKENINEYYNSPIIMLDSLRNIWGYNNSNKKYPIYINPCISNFGIQKIISGNQMYQDIEMWLSRDKPIPDMDRTEKEAVQQHGMDKWSFRKMKKNT